MKRYLAFAAALLLLALGAGYSRLSDETGGIAFPYSMGATPVTLAGGGEAQVELLMTGGKRWTDADPDFAAGGGLIAGSENFAGQFELQVTIEGKVVSTLPVAFEDEAIFYGPVTLQFADYNGDGDPEFALGTWVWSGGKQFYLYSVGREGSLTQVGYIERHDVMEPSPLLENPEPGVLATKWKQADLEETILYRWDGAQYTMQK